jgi:hypothetical protein
MPRTDSSSAPPPADSSATDLTSSAGFARLYTRALNAKIHSVTFVELVTLVSVSRRMSHCSLREQFQLLRYLFTHCSRPPSLHFRVRVCQSSATCPLAPLTMLRGG